MKEKKIKEVAIYLWFTDTYIANNYSVNCGDQGYNYIICQ